jgi:hypothetical protein
MMKRFSLNEIPEIMFPLVNDKTRTVTMFCSRGAIEKISIMRGMYRVYINAGSSGGSGEYRWTPEQAAEIIVSIV